MLSANRRLSAARSFARYSVFSVMSALASRASLRLGLILNIYADKRREFRTTVRLETTIAAAAKMGLRTPVTARVMPAAL